MSTATFDPATDISANILSFAERRAQEAGVTNVATRVMDGGPARAVSFAHRA